MFKNKGFTLIELLVAITILAIVASVGFATFSQAQIAGRDTKRKDDLRQVAIAVELFFNSQTPTHFYPTGNWSNLTTALIGPPSYINRVPLDPLDPTRTYTYVSNGSCGAGACGFDLCARLENNNEPTVNNPGVIDGGGPPCNGSSGQRYFHLTNP